MIEDGAETNLGHIVIYPHPPPNISRSPKSQNLMRIVPEEEKPPSTIDLANSTSISSNETDSAVSATAGNFSVFAELQGRILSVSAVFMTLLLGIVHISAFGTTNIVQDFAVRVPDSNTELVYEHYGARRTSPPFFTYHAAAYALKFIPKYMFAQRRFEEVVFVLEVGGTPLGQGVLRKSPSASSTT